MTKRLAAAALLVALLFLLPTTAAGALSADSVTLTSSAASVVYGQGVTLSGAISPQSAGETVEIHDDADATVGSAATDASGGFSLVITPERNMTLHAVWQSAVSPAVAIGVRAIVHVHLRPVRLFDAVTVRGSVSPPLAGAKVKVSLVLAGKVVASRRAAIGGAGRFSATFTVEEPGAYRARATFDDADHLKGMAVDGPRHTPLPTLHVGSRGEYVRALERRLVELHYRLVVVNNAYDYRTADAVLAFRKLQGMQRVFTVDAATWRALADPRTPRPRFDMKRFHIEVDQTHQVLLTVQGGEITNILHISTGKPSTPTHDGRFHVYRKYAGLTGGGLYYPSYFDGLRALHGYVEVPTYAASHGCVRIPYWNARWVYGLASIGTPVMVYH